MFHAVNQMTGEELGSPGAGALPMFREENASSAGRGGGGGASSSSSSEPRNGPSRRSHQGGAGTSSDISGSIIPADATGGAAMALEMRPLHHGGGAAPRRRRSGNLKDITGGRAAVTTASPDSAIKQLPAVAFAGPDGVDTGSFAEAGTFRWDATIADAATAQQDGLGEDGLEQDEGSGSGSRRSSRTGERVVGGSRRGGSYLRRGKIAASPPLSGDMADIALTARYSKPWYIITPESKMHQILDHLGELCVCFSKKCGVTPLQVYVYVGQVGWRVRGICRLTPHAVAEWLDLSAVHLRRLEYITI